MRPLLLIPLLVACGSPVEPPQPAAIEGCTYTHRIPIEGGGVLVMTAHYRPDHPYCRSLSSAVSYGTP